MKRYFIYDEAGFENGKLIFNKWQYSIRAYDLESAKEIIKKIFIRNGTNWLDSISIIRDENLKPIWINPNWKNDQNLDIDLKYKILI